MNDRITHRLAGAEGELECAVGKSAVSYTAQGEGSLQNLVIYGSALPTSSPFGKLNSSTGKYDINVRVHGINVLGGEEFEAALINRLGSEITYNRYGSYLEYSFSYPSDYIFVGTSPNVFKENTVYTFRFEFIGRAGCSTGIKIAYSDFTSEDILAREDGSPYIAYTSVEGKTVRGLQLSYAGAERYKINLDSFGIFEGAHGYDYFEEYRGQTYVISTSSAYCGHTAHGVSAYDTFDWKNKLSTLRLRKTSVSSSMVYEHDYEYYPTVIAVNLTHPTNPERPLDYFYYYDRVGSYEELNGRFGAYCFGDEYTIYLTLQDGYWNAYEMFYSEKGLIYARKTPEYKKESDVPDIPSVHAGYVGIEVYSNTTPQIIKAYYKP